MLDLPSTALPRKGVVIRLVSFFFGIFRAARQHLCIRSIPRASIANRPVFFYASSNQRRAIKTVAEHVVGALPLGVCKDDPSLRQETQQLDLLLPYLASIFYLPWILIMYCRSRGYRRRSFAYALDDYLLACGYNLYLRCLLAREQPSMVVMSNDHSMLNRVLLGVCKERHVPTVYIQHASVTETFPKLGFDYAFLEGQDALRKYSAKGLAGCTVFLSGIASLDEAIKRLRGYGGPRNAVSLCASTLDQVEDVVGLACAIRERTNSRFPVVIRPHPGDIERMAEWRDGAARIGVHFSDPQVEDSTDLIIKSAVVVASDSNILLEAAILKAKPIAFPYTNAIVDWYGFIRNRVASHCGSLEALLAEISGEIDWRDYWKASKHYCGIIGTSFEGRSAELIGFTLSTVLSGEPVPAKWVATAPGIFELKATDRQSEAASVWP